MRDFNMNNLLDLSNYFCKFFFVEGMLQGYSKEIFICKNISFFPRLIGSSMGKQQYSLNIFALTVS